MPITDAFTTFTRHQAIVADGVSDVVSLMPFAGNGGPINVLVLPKNYDAGSLEVMVQDSDDGLNFRDVGAYYLSELAAPDAMLRFTLPQEVKGTWVRLAYTVDGASTGTLWAGITRDHVAMYERKLLIDSGLAA